LLNRFQSEDLSKPFKLFGANSTRDFLNAEAVCDRIIDLVKMNYVGIVNIASGKSTKIIDFVKSISSVDLTFDIDETEKVMKKIIEKSNFKITYARFDKRVGKCRSDNLLLDLAIGNYILWCDSDDSLKKDALEILEKNISNSEENNYIGVVALCENQNGEIQSTGKSKFKPFICKWSELASKYKMENDMCILINRKLISNKRFPEHDLVMNEAGYWDQFMDKKIICIPNILKVMQRNTSNKISGSNLMEYCRGKAYSIVYAESYKYKKFELKKQMLIATNFHRYCRHGDIYLRKRNELFKEKNIIYYISIIFGLILAIKDEMQKKVVKSHKVFLEGQNATYKIISN
jgi:hypothetical protein